MTMIQAITDAMRIEFSQLFSRLNELLPFARDLSSHKSFAHGRTALAFLVFLFVLAAHQQHLPYLMRSRTQIVNVSNDDITQMLELLVGTSTEAVLLDDALGERITATVPKILLRESLNDPEVFEAVLLDVARQQENKYFVLK